MLEEVAAMDTNQLLLSSVQIENTLTILYSRAIMVRILAAWQEEQDMSSKVVGHHHMLLQLLKVRLLG